MQISKSFRDDRRKKIERPSEQFQNLQKNHRDGYGLKDQNHGVQQTNECGGIR